MLEQKRKNVIQENAIIVGIHLKENTESSLNEEIEELVLLADTAGAKIIDTVIQKTSRKIP